VIETNREVGDRIWAKFRAPVTPSLDEQIDEALELVSDEQPDEQILPAIFKTINDEFSAQVELALEVGAAFVRGGALYALCGAAIVSTMPCTMPAGHTGPHSHHGAVHWGLTR